MCSTARLSFTSGPKVSIGLKLTFSDGTASRTRGCMLSWEKLLDTYAWNSASESTTAK